MLGAFLALAVGLTGCVAADQGSVAERPYSEVAARDVFTDAYHHVHDRYIDAVSLERIALEGLKELSKLDQSLQIEADARTISLVAEADRQLLSLPRPSAHDSRGWGRLTAAVMAEGRRSSDTLARQDPDAVYSAVFSGLLRGLDDYSRYTDPRTANQARASREGFGGLGVTIHSEDHGTRILHVLPDTPAERGGLKGEDLITHVDGLPLEGLDRYDVVERLRGPIGSRVLLTVERGEPAQMMKFELTRAHVVPRTVTWEVTDGIAYMKLTSFNRRTARDLRNAVNAAERESGGWLSGLVLDLRNNSGGLLDQAVAVADLFLDDGVILSTRGRHPASNSTFAATQSEIAVGAPMVILVNGRSASASEMVAAALQDRGRAVVIGTATHGKGSVQNVARMPNGGELIITWSRMHAPSGYIIDKLGVLPGLCTSIGLADPLDQRRGGAYDAAQAVADWHAYTAHDTTRARTLRMSCPAHDDEPESEIDLATRVLTDAAAYRASLRPWRDIATASRDGWPTTWN